MGLTDRINKLAIAVFTGDMGGARALMLDMAHDSERWAEAVQRGRRAANPPPPLPSLESRPLPAPGHLRGSTEGLPRLATDPAAVLFVDVEDRLAGRG
jgi:hypothetical protein